MNLDGAKRSNYDPDEMVEEQRERQLRKRLNNLFKDFASKVIGTQSFLYLIDYKLVIKRGATVCAVIPQ